MYPSYFKSETKDMKKLINIAQSQYLKKEIKILFYAPSLLWHSCKFTDVGWVLKHPYLSFLSVSLSRPSGLWTFLCIFLGEVFPEC